jgi:hypothetical protein
MAIVQFAFKVYEYKERQQQPRQGCGPRNFMRTVHASEYIAALVTGFLDRHSDTLNDRRAQASPLKIFGQFLDLWVDACGLDFSKDEPISSSDDDDENLPIVFQLPLSALPLMVCFSKQGQNALPVVELLLKSGYKPSLGSV